MKKIVHCFDKNEDILLIIVYHVLWKEGRRELELGIGNDEEKKQRPLFTRAVRTGPRRRVDPSFAPSVCSFPRNCTNKIWHFTNGIFY